MVTASRRRSGEQRDSGFSLIELVIAMVVMGTMSLAVIGVIMNAQAQGVTNRSRIGAANLAAREIDLVREQFAASDSGPIDLANAGLVVNPHPLAGGTAGQPLKLDGQTYTVKRLAEWNISGTGASACEGGSLVAYPSLGITVTVTWPNMRSVKPVVSTAALAPDKDTGIPSTDSFVAAKVLDQSAAPLSGILVTATGGATSSAYTDSTGCAVIRVTPATGGTSYTVKVADSSYVDLSGVVNPSKATGLMNPGSIYAGASFTVGRAGSVTVRLVRSDGQALTNAQVAGSALTLVATQYSGASGASARTATGVSTTFTGLYPTSYGAYFGSVAPTSGYTVTPLPAGGAVTIDVPFEMATVDATLMPAGTTSVLAVPAGTAATCPAGVGVSAAVSGGAAHFTLMPGLYDFYASGTQFACSPGPTGQSLASGDNNDVAWAATRLRLVSVPAGGTVWAVNKQASGITSATTCPAPSAALAMNVDGARSALIDLPAGSWWVWQTDGAYNGTCTSYPDLINSFATTYGTDTQKTWGATPLYSTLTMSNITASRYLVISTAVTSGTCTATTVPTTGTKYTSTTGTTANGQSLSVSSVPRPTSGQLTYYAYLWNKTGSNGSIGCTAVGTYVVGPATASLTRASGTGSVGP
ncbi:type IV pilus modification PilV family protein [Cellulomonas sp. ICMP 17802]|uniref:type IV pilus modification PilV family protein n=1 Tax=Cellulomonas sp. ICMP 17802 TaxID=3239199 RepID=UPI00351BBB79